MHQPSFRTGLFALLLLSLGHIRAADSTPAVSPETSHPVVPAKKYAEEVTYSFAPCVFSTAKFPEGSFEADKMVRDFLGPVKVETAFYNAQFQKVATAETPGRYGAVVHITLGDGTELWKYLTLYRAPEKFRWHGADLAVSLHLPPGLGINPAVVHRQRDALSQVVDEIFSGDAYRSSTLAILLAGLAETSPAAPPEHAHNDPFAQDQAWWFQLRRSIGREEHYNYQIDLPLGYDAAPGKKWPLILFLHGSGERGTDLAKLAAHGPPKLIAHGKKFPAIVVSPQCPPREWWNPFILTQLLDNLAAKYRIDPDRIVVTGLSMGGFGTWDLALLHPDRFAAIAPICGGSDPGDAARLRNLPIWDFHGQKDDHVPVEMSIEMVDAITKAGGHPHLTLYPDLGHNSWTRAYETDALFTWLLAQKRGQAEDASALPAPAD